jgi:hypothetical protein
MKRSTVCCVVLLGLTGLLGPGSASALAAGKNTGHQQPAPKPVSEAKSTLQTPPTNAEAQVAQERGCSSPKLRSVDVEHAHTPHVTPEQPVEFTVQETSSVLNFGSGRDKRADYIVLKASQPIPEGIYSTNFEIDSLQPLRRIGEASLESTHLKPPTFTPPHFFNHRKEIGFNLCVDASGGKPGTYTGQFQFVSPGAIETVTLTQTAQLKAEDAWFWGPLILVGVLALILLITNVYVQSEGGWKKWTPQQRVARIVLIIFSVGAALSAMLIAWSQNPTWGENIWVAVGALVTTAFTAAGLGSTLTAAAGQIKTNSGGDETAKPTPPPPPTPPEEKANGD